MTIGLTGIIAFIVVIIAIKLIEKRKPRPYLIKCCHCGEINSERIASGRDWEQYVCHACREIYIVEKIVEP
jgi:hypothetical protein